MRARHLVLGAAALAWMAASPTIGNAASPGWSGGTFCTSGFNACASVWLDVSVDGQTLTLTIKNLSSYNGHTTDPNSIAVFGLYHLGAPAWSGNATLFSAWSTTRGDVTGLWSLGGTTLLNPLSIEVGGSANEPNPIANGIHSNGEEAVTFVITLDNPWEDVDATQAAWHHRGDPDSYKNSTTVPEPGALALLGTGLMGILGVAGVRRRRNGFDV